MGGHERERGCGDRSILWSTICLPTYLSVFLAAGWLSERFCARRENSGNDFSNSPSQLDSPNSLSTDVFIRILVGQ